MRSGIHPKNYNIKVSCSCGNNFVVNSTLSEDFAIDICDQCHPFYTGKQKIVDTTGRVERFNQMYGKIGILSDAKQSSKSED